MNGNWSDITVQSFQNVWAGTLEFLPRLFWGGLIFIVGLFVSSAVGKIVARILEGINFDGLFQRSGWKAALESADIQVKPSEFVGAIIKWILVIVFLQIFVEMLGLVEFAGFLISALAWLPNVLIAAAIFVVSIIIADILEKILRASIRKLGIRYSKILGVAVRGAIYTFAVLAILLQLGVAENIINALVMGFVGMFSLAFGLAFGLGGREVAAEIIRGIRDKLVEK